MDDIKFNSVNTNPTPSNAIFTTNNNNNNSPSTSPTRKKITQIIPISSISDLRIITKCSGIGTVLPKYSFGYTPLHLACCGGDKYFIFWGGDEDDCYGSSEHRFKYDNTRITKD